MKLRYEIILLLTLTLFIYLIFGESTITIILFLIMIFGYLTIQLLPIFKILVTKYLSYNIKIKRLKKRLYRYEGNRVGFHIIIRVRDAILMRIAYVYDIPINIVMKMYRNGLLNKLPNLPSILYKVLYDDNLTISDINQALDLLSRWY